MNDIAAINKSITDFNALVTTHNKSMEAYNTLAKAWTADPSLDLREVTRAFPKT